MQDTREVITRLIVDHLGVAPERVTPEAVLRSEGCDDESGLGADSLDIVELTMALEEAFGIDIPDSESAKMLTVDDAVRVVNEARGITS